MFQASFTQEFSEIVITLCSEVKEVIETQYQEVENYVLGQVEICHVCGTLNYPGVEFCIECKEKLKDPI